MTEDEEQALLKELEDNLQLLVQDQLDQVAVEFADSVDAATELVAAAFSVSGIREMWRRRVPTIMTALRRIAGRSATVTAESLNEPTPKVAELDDVLVPYEDATRPLVESVGDNLARAAQRSLAEGVAAGEDLDQLKARMVSVFDETGAQLGPVRASRIAQTEANRAWNAGVQASAEALSTVQRPVVKQWRTMNDERVRRPHAAADGQLRLLSETFSVGGFAMRYPGDPQAPADQTINCRCRMRATRARAAATAASTEEGNPLVEDNLSAAADGDAEELASRMPPQLKRYWLAGPGALKIRWGTPGSFERCVKALRPDFPQDPEGLCANLYHEATGRWPGSRSNNSGADVHTGAMIALVPSQEDAERLALKYGEQVDQLHLTLYYLGDAADWSQAEQEEIRGLAQATAGAMEGGPVQARAFGVAQWNPAADDPAWVWNIGDDNKSTVTTLRDVHDYVTYSLEARQGAAQVPPQYTPWAPHVCAVYGSEDHTAELAERCGPVTFDRIRVAFAGENWDYPLGPAGEQLDDCEDEWPMDPNEYAATESDMMPTTVPWYTPAPAALAYENRQTGDGRVFAPDALYWDGSGPWPLQYADEMQGGHDGARLAGAIETLERDGDRLAGTGVLYLTQEAGQEAAGLLAQGAPLGVSVDLDDVDLELVDATPGGQAEAYRVKLLTASVLPLADGGWTITGETSQSIHADSSGGGLAITSGRFTIFSDADGSFPASSLVAAAGDPDVEGTVVDTQRSGDMLMRITRGRVRGATLVSIPAYSDARIVLTDPGMFASLVRDEELSAAAAQTDYERVIRYVRKSQGPVSAADVAKFLKISIIAARRYLARAAQKGEAVRMTRGMYTGPTESAAAALTASVTGSVDLPVAERATEWNGDDARDRVFVWADGDTDRIAEAFAYRDDEIDPTTKAAYKLGYADVQDGTLVIIPNGVSTAIGAMHGARGTGVDIPADQRDAVLARLEAVQQHVDQELGGQNMETMEASAWQALAQMPEMPASWFREPTAAELPPGGPGVNYVGGRIFGWVAQADEPHAGYAKKVVINDLGRIDTTHFLRQRMALDDGSTVKVGAFTMNAGHHRDGAECETSACQFDDTRTVAGIVTVGMNAGGMWFSGAAAPWLSEWDRSVFATCQPSYHMRRGNDGRWQLRAVLSVPVPGHSSPLLASAVIERSQMALTAAATMAEVEEVVSAEKQRQLTTVQLTAPDGIDYDRLADSLVAAMARAEERKVTEARELAELRAAASEFDTEGI